MGSEMPPTDRAFVIEEEALLMLEIQDLLAGHGFAEVRHHRNVVEAAPHFDELAAFDLAIVEGRLGAEEVVSFTERLAKAGVPTVVLSADRGAAQFFPHAAATVGKPFDAATLLAACDAAMTCVS